MSKVIGRGIWLDKVAQKVVDREKALGRNLNLIRVESGIGASGIVHLGSVGDAIRAYGVKLALENLGYKSELIAFSDDMDGLRKVPAGLPDSLQKYLLHPVSRIPDPFGCHRSFGVHVSSLLLDALDRCGIKYHFQSALDTYSKGLLTEQMLKIMKNADLVGRKIREMVGQKKFETVLPYFPICSRCGRIYVAEAYDFLPDEKKVLYRCKGAKIGGRFVEGCGNEGEACIWKDEGKLNWKIEFAARWAALDIRFEAHGKDIADSVRINDWIADEILKYPHPYHVRYEIFLDKSGRKISKSSGNVITPQTWLKYGSPESLRLLMFKRIIGSRRLSVEDIPAYMDEYDYLEDVYFGRVHIDNVDELRKLRGLYEYVNLLEPPKQPSIHIPFRLLISLASVSPEGKEVEYVVKKLRSYNMISEPDRFLLEKIRLALAWANDFQLPKTEIKLSSQERKALEELAKFILSEERAEKIQARIFTVARENGLHPPALFGIIYKILIGSSSGPRLGPYIVDMGREKVSSILMQFSRESEA
ncbi:MAG: lysine--tRNA ligase [Thermoproteota archaeon]